MAAKRILGGLLLWQCVGLVSTLAADPQIREITPQGGQRGTRVDVQIQGDRIGDGAYQLLLSEPGITVSDWKAVDGAHVTLTLAIEDDCRVGRHDLRLRTNTGISNLMTFHVGALPEISEVEPNPSPVQPQQIRNNVVINGMIKAGDIDVYRVDLAEGQRLSVEIEGMRLGRTMFDPLLEVHDGDGKLLASCDDQPAAQQDAFLTLRAPSTGPLLVTVREMAFRGNDSSTYRLHVGSFPRPSAVFPPVAQRGTATEFHWIDEHGQQAAFSQAIPDTTQETYELHAADPLGISPSGLPVYLVGAPPILETEPNDNHDQANEVPFPAVVTGVIDKPSDRDYFRFTMKKDEQWDFRLRARELRSPLDGVIHIFDGERKYLQGNDDDRGQPDSYLRFKAPADGEYYAEVEDRQLRGRPTMTYVLEVTAPSPVAELQLEERQRWVAQVVPIPQGGRTAAMVSVGRRDFGGPVQLDWEGLPAGSKAEVPVLDANFNRVPVLFTADKEAPVEASLATPSARLTESETPLLNNFRQQNWLVRGRNNVHVWSHFADRAPVTVTAPLPYSIEAVEPQAPLVQGGSMQLKIVATRDEGFDGSIAIRTIYNPPGVSTNQSLSIAKDQTEVLIPITANSNARVGEWKLAFLGRGSIYGRVECSTQLVPLTIAEPYFDVKIPTHTALQGSESQLKLALEHRTEFTGDAELQLLRLPPGVTAEKVQVQAGATEAVFNLKIAPDARVGRHRGVACEVLLHVQGEPVLYTQGYAELRIDPQPAEVAAGSQSESKPAGGSS